MLYIDEINKSLKRIHKILSGNNEIPELQNLKPGERLAYTSESGKVIDRNRKVINPDDYYKLTDLI